MKNLNYSVYEDEAIAAFYRYSPPRFIKIAGSRTSYDAGDLTVYYVWEKLPNGRKQPLDPCEEFMENLMQTIQEQLKLRGETNVDEV